MGGRVVIYALFTAIVRSGIYMPITGEISGTCLIKQRVVCARFPAN